MSIMWQVRSHFDILFNSLSYSPMWFNYTQEKDGNRSLIILLVRSERTERVRESTSSHDETNNRK